MSMDLDKLTEKLLQAAREPADEHVPYAFEKRIMARLRELPAPVLDPILLWARSLWNAVPWCVALSVGIFLLTHTSGERPAGSLDLALEQTVIYPDEIFAQVW